MMIHTYMGETIHLNIIYKQRASVSIRVDGYGSVEVHAPKGTPAAFVLPLVEEKWEWIQQTIKDMKARLDGPEEKVYNPGEPFLYLGKPYPIYISVEPNLKKDYAEVEGEKLHVYVNRRQDEQIKKALQRFYTRQCKALVQKRIKVYQPHFKTKPASIRITDSSRTWGTCDSGMRLTFNWKLAMAPLEVIDYVVVHEMCHMVHLNHDRSFWRLVGKLSPDYKKQESWLSHSSWKMTV